MKYYITNNKDSEYYLKKFNNISNCKNWIINNLDLSKDWTIFNGLWKVKTNINWNNKRIIL